MFAGIRSWWGRGQGEVSLRLFLFELVVVIIGVLIAQGVASLAQDRADLADMESERARLRWELQDARSSLQSWHGAVPCLDARLRDVMLGKTMTSPELRRPDLVSADVVPPTPEVMELLRQRHGNAEMLALNWIFSRLDAIERASLIVRQRWAMLALIDPANGTPSASDRAAAREAVAEIRNELRRIEADAGDSEALFVRLGIPARELYTPDRGPAKSCDAIWRTGVINPPLTTR